MDINYTFLPPPNLIDVKTVNGKVILSNSEELNLRLSGAVQILPQIGKGKMNPLRKQIRSRKKTMLDGVEGTLPK